MSRVITAPGQRASLWTAALDALEPHEPTDLLELGSGDRLVVAVPHPDDETLAVGGLLQRLHSTGVQIVLILATAGEAAYGESGDRALALGRIRLREFREAIAALGLDPVEVHQLDLPDGRLDEYEAALLEAFTGTLSVQPPGARGRTAVLAPWTKDPHPDHQAVGRAAGAAARHAGSVRWSYPVWMRHVLHPEDPEIPWPDLRRVALCSAERMRKLAAIGLYPSQLKGPTVETGPVLPPYVVAHFTDGHELLIRPAPDDDEVGAHFEALYEGSADPWQVGSSWYEQRKRSILLASLPRLRYRSAWEPGCSLGHLTAELAQRCDRLLSSDISPRAVAGARHLVAADNVTIDVAQTPVQVPELGSGSCDLVVLSEFLYYLPDRARAATIELAGELLAPGGHVVVAHWRGHPADAHCSGEQANAEVVAAFGSSLVHHVDEHFVLDVAAAGDLDVEPRAAEHGDRADRVAPADGAERP